MIHRTLIIHIYKANNFLSGRIETPAAGKENRKPKVTKNAKEGKKKPEKKHNDTPHQPGTLQEAIGRVSRAGRALPAPWPMLYCFIICYVYMYMWWFFWQSFIWCMFGMLQEVKNTYQTLLFQLNVGQMENLLDVVKSRFQDSPLIWLKDLASYLNVRVNPIHAPDPAFRGHPPLYPTSMLSSSVKDVSVALACSVLESS